MKCLILAAGKGTRLSDKGLPKPLVSVLGKPLIERVILTAKASGISDFLVVTGFEGERVRAFLDLLQEKEDISITHVINEKWDKENGISVLCAQKYLEGPFLLTMCDHLLPQGAFGRMLKADLEDGEVALLVDRQVGRFAQPELAEATKVLVREGKVVQIGKDLGQYNGIDTGLFLCTYGIFEALKRAQDNGDTTLSAGIRLLASQGRVRAVDGPGGPWFDIDDHRSINKAERELLRGLKKTTDGPISRYINRPLSLRITRYLVNTRLTPNQLSFFSFIAALLSGVVFSAKGYVALVMGAVLAQFSSVLDGCDGEVARLKYQASEFGGWFDAVLDRYADAFIVLGLTIHLLWERITLGPVIAGYFAITGSLINSYTAHKYDSYLRDKLKSRPVTFRLGRDLRVFLIFIGALLDRVLATLVLLAVVTNLENIRRMWVLYREWSGKRQ